MPLLKKFLVATIGLLAVVTISLIGLTFYVTSDAGERFLARRASIWLGEWYRGQARIGKLDLSLWHRTLELSDLELIGSDGELHVNRAVARFPWWPPASRWTISELFLNGLRLDFPSGLPQAFRPRAGSGGAGMPITIGKLRLSGAQVRWGGIAGGLTIRADRLASQGRLEPSGYSGDVQAGPARLNGLQHPIRLRRIRSSLIQRGSRLTLRGAVAELGASRLEANGAIDFGESPYRLEVSGTLRLEDVREWLPEALAGRGTVELNARLQPDPAGVRFAGAATTQAARIPPWTEPFAARADFSVTPRALRVRKIEFAGLGGRAQGKLDWQLEAVRQAPRLELRFSEIDLRRLLEPQLDRKLPLTANISGSASLRLPADAPLRGTVRAQAQAARLTGTELSLQGPVTVEFEPKGQTLNTTLTSGSHAIGADVTRGSAGDLGGRVVLSSPDSADLFKRLNALLPAAARRFEPQGGLQLSADLSGDTGAPILDLDGRLETLGTALGPLRSLEVDLHLLLGPEPSVCGELSAQSARLSDSELGPIAARGLWSASRLELESLQAVLLGGRLVAGGRYTSERLELDFQADDLDLARLEAGLRTAGRLDTSGHLEGPIDRFDGEVELQARGLVLNDQRLGDVTGHARAAAGTVELDLQVPARRASASATLQLQPGWPASLELVLGTQSLEQLLGSAPGPDWSGELGLRAQLELALARPKELSGTITLEPLRLRFAAAELAASEPVRWTLARGAITLEPARIQGAAGSMLLSGSLEPFAPARPFQLDAELDAFPLDPLAALLARPETDLSGSATGTLRVSGSLERPAAAEASLHLDAFHAQAEGVRVRNREPLIVHLKAGRLSLEQFTLEGDQTLLTLSGGIDLEPRAALDLQAAGSVDLVLLNPFLDFGAAGGKLILSGTIQGPPAAPLVSGHGWLQDGILRFYELPLRFGDARGRFAFDRSAVEVKEFDADLGGGRFGATGSLALSGWKPRELALQAQARGVRLRFPGELRGEYNADLELTGGPQRYRLSG
ncbi:MAG TPA: hypothetical protein VGB99_17030, partial [Acidobacteriota bacterium]